MKRRKTKAVLEAEEALQRTLQRVGYTGKFKGKSPHSIPDYKVDVKHSTTNCLGNGIKKRSNAYSGIELLGIAQLHKSNAVPIRKEDKQGAIDVAQMRRN